MFEIEFSKEAENDIKMFDKKTAEVLIRKIYSIIATPLHYLERLVGFTLWKLRIGDYRAIIQVNTNSGKLYVVKAGHRKHIYKNLRD
ncbi:MAG: type II toxin-antitoxin system RelE/ParE family toxin [Nanoarchaeota archaeon]|nr:type II toxin-antitoxin system RelE/ParE family toxin [Nanoarchaeota archaeon]